MKRLAFKYIDFIFLLFIIAAVLAIYFPVFSAEYLYTDEASQLWLTKKGINYQTSVPQGRYITYVIMKWVFSYINNIHQVIYARLFSLIGWIMCLPIWYYIISKICNKNGFSKALVLLFMVYLITMPPFIIYIGWSACMQMFIACTSALVAGNILYNDINCISVTEKMSSFKILIIFCLGLIALFTYQNCYGCFFIPFFIHFISEKKFSKRIYIGMFFSLFTFIIYYFLFKYSLSVSNLVPSERNSITTNPLNKLLFLFYSPLNSAFHFTYLFNEKSIYGFIVYGFIFSIWLLVNLLVNKTTIFSEKVKYFLGLNLFAILIYLPSLIVKENYSSNRTLFALDLFVFFLVAETVFSCVKRKNLDYIITVFLSTLFLLNAWYNYNKQFIDPLKLEYNFVKNIIMQRFKPGILTVHFICPSEYLFKEKYNIATSWDEFGEPSTSKKWVPEPFIRQLILEKTGDMLIAQNIEIKTWSSKEDFEKSSELILNESLLIEIK